MVRSLGTQTVHLTFNVVLLKYVVRLQSERGQNTHSENGGFGKYPASDAPLGVRTLPVVEAISFECCPWGVLLLRVMRYVCSLRVSVVLYTAVYQW